MKRLDLRGSILLAIGAGSFAAVACGGVESTGKGTGDASRDGAIESEGGSESGDGADDQDVAGDAFASDAVDAPNADGCVPVGQLCTHSSDCCNAWACLNGNAACNGQSTCTCQAPSVRRPFLVGSSLRVAPAAERPDWVKGDEAVQLATGLDPATAAALARDWLLDGCEEHASIAAFARFTMHLVSVGAPPEMILASQSAAIDEVRHARACFALARRYGKRAMGPGALSLEGAMTPMTLVEIAALAAEEGCVGETLGVLLAEEQLARTVDPVVRALLVSASIVADEARHAELAWSFVSWAVARGGQPVRRAVAAAVKRAIEGTLAAPVRTYAGIDVDAWRAHGRLTCADARAVAERGVREVVAPCAAALLARGDEKRLGGRFVSKVSGDSRKA